MIRLLFRSILVELKYDAHSSISFACLELLLFYFPLDFTAHCMPSVPCLGRMPRWWTDKYFMASTTWRPRDYSSFIRHFPFNATSKKANKNDAKGKFMLFKVIYTIIKQIPLKKFHCACNRTALQEPNLPTRKSIDVTMPRSQKWKKGSFWYLQLPIYTCRHQHCHKVTNHSLLLGSFDRSSEALIRLLLITEPCFWIYFGMS